jgi:hypothetical protein
MARAKHVLSDAEGHASKNSKHEIQNSKQAQMTKIDKISNKLHSAPCFGFSALRFFCLGVCFGFRYSDFGFVSLVAWREKIS